MIHQKFQIKDSPWSILSANLKGYAGPIGTCSLFASSVLSRRLRDASACPAQVLFELPVAAAASLAGDYQIEARHEGDKLAAGPGLF